MDWLCTAILLFTSLYKLIAWADKLCSYVMHIQLTKHNYGLQLKLVKRIYSAHPQEGISWVRPILCTSTRGHQLGWPDTLHIHKRASAGFARYSAHPQEGLSWVRPILCTSTRGHQLGSPVSECFVLESTGLSQGGGSVVIIETTPHRIASSSPRLFSTIATRILFLQLDRALSLHIYVAFVLRIGAQCGLYYLCWKTLTVHLYLE